MRIVPPSTQLLPNECVKNVGCITHRFQACELMFVSAEHKIIVPKLRRVRVAARRQRELMAIIAAGEFEDAEWVDEDLVDLTGLGYQ